eukprot:IDg21482t1
MRSAGLPVPGSRRTYAKISDYTCRATPCTASSAASSLSAQVSTTTDLVLLTSSPLRDLSLVSAGKVEPLQHPLVPFQLEMHRKC